jgi:two-component system CheB/CheR fusion protein
MKEYNIKPHKTTKINLNDFPIVGIGASAGGLEALELFFKKMPANNGMAFVVIQHLDPNQKDILPEILQRITAMKVLQVSDNLKIKPNHIYVIPPNRSMSILDGTLHLFEIVKSNGLHLPIDFFFSSLANEKQEKSFGIVLSGMGSDGSLGVKSIKEKNGIVLVQEPDSAKYASMPRAAIASANVDIVAIAEQLPEKLIAFVKRIPQIKTEYEIESKTNTSLDKIIILLREHTGHDFSLYKKNTFFRRIERRKEVHQIEKIQNYVRFLQENPKEIEILFKEMLIGVTSFFRDKTVWALLEEKIIPEIIDELPNGHLLRAWIPACSTGEEAYSLAIIFKEVLEKNKNHKKITLQIFATDLDRDAIEKARKGYFPVKIKEDVSPERLKRFFKIEEKGFRINNTIREMVVFAPQNVIKDPPFTKLDFLFCRNFLIYIEPELQKKLINLFNYSLNPGGIMILGTAETLGNKNAGFNVLDSKLKIFKRSGILQPSEFINFPSSFTQSKTITKENVVPMKVVENIQTLADQVLIQRYAPASVLINDKGDIIYITGRTGKYLEPVAGKANWNVHAMAREGLRQVLPGALRKAMQNIDPIILKNIKVGTNGGTQYVDVTVQRIENPDALKGMIIIVFNDMSSIIENNSDKLKTGKKKSTEKYSEIEIELQRCYEDLQSTREEMQTSQEELKSTNEELQSTNEELQSTNEELTTSKEEMQSMNEELQTVNVELQNKVNDYESINNDMKNLLNSTEIATLFLDKELNIRRFTEQVTKIVKLRDSDIGRPFTDLVSDLQYPEIDNHARKVIKTLITFESVISTNDKRWFTVRIMPYRTFDDRIDGLVITFIDITISKKLEMELKKINEKIKKK